MVLTKSGRGIICCVLLLCSNSFMTTAWCVVCAWQAHVLVLILSELTRAHHGSLSRPPQVPPPEARQLEHGEGHPVVVAHRLLRVSVFALPVRAPASSN